MKKSKLSIGLVTSFIGALALTACNDTTAAVTKSKSSVVDFIGYNGKTDKIEVNVDELYKEYTNSTEGTTLYYNAILEVLTRYSYKYVYNKDKEEDKILKSPERINTEARDKVRAVQQTAKDNAKSNGTSYDKEWDKILKSHDVKSTKALKLKFVYELEKEELSNWYYKAHSESKDVPVDPESATSEMEHISGLREQYLGVSKDWGEVTGKTENVDSAYPYHILHILVKLSADKNDYTRGTITQEEAKKLWQVVRALIQPNVSWAQVALLSSDDSSKDNAGDVGIMSTSTSFYNEFKLGIYAYDAILSKVNTPDPAKNQSIYDAFGIGNDLNGHPATVVTEQLSSGVKTELVTDLIQQQMVLQVNTHQENQSTVIPTIPFDVFRQINIASEKEKIDDIIEPEGSEASLPRNVLYNAFLNFHSPFVITNELLNTSSVSFGDDKIGTTVYGFDDENILKLDSTNFKGNKIAGVTDEEDLSEDHPDVKNVLCDAEGNVIIGVRSEAGIHFMVMRKSVFENTNKQVGKEGTSLLDYYTTAVPGDADFPTSGQTYVNMKKSDNTSYYTDRANTIKSDIKSTDTFDAAFDYRIYETLLDFEINGKKLKDKLVFSDEDPETHESVVRDNIQKVIDLSREQHHENRFTSINSAWKDYLLMLIEQNKWRSDVDEFKGAFVPTTCAFIFDKDHQNEWKKDVEGGSRCYVK